MNVKRSPLWIITLGFAAIAMPQGPGPSPSDSSGLNGNTRPPKAKYVYDFETWRPSEAVRPWIPLSDKAIHLFMSKGKTADEIHELNDWMAELRREEGWEQRRRGSLIVRRLEEIVALEKTDKTVKRGSKDWEKFGLSDEDQSFFGKARPATVRDYCNGDLVTSTGSWGPQGKPAGDVDRLGGYRFPHTVGNGILAVALAGIPLSLIHETKGFIEGKDGMATGTYSFERDGIKRDAKLTIERASGHLARYEESSGGHLNYLVTVGGYTQLKNGTFAPKLVSVQLLSAPEGRKVEEATYTFKSASFGDDFDVSDMKSLGPVGLEVLDNRLKLARQVPYRLGSEPLSDAEVKRLGDGMEMPQLTHGNQLSRNPVLIYVGCALLGIGAFWVAKKRRP